MDINTSLTTLDDSIATQDDIKIPTNIKEAVLSMKVESAYWDKAFSDETPDDAVYEREGAKGEMLEYVKDSYTIRRLNSLYPGWSTDEMKIEYIPNLATFIVTGYLLINYLTISGPKRRKIWAVGSSVVQMKTDQSKGILPSQPDDVAKAAYTEWIKLVGKRLGIGIDIFEQSITKELQESYIKRVEKYKHTNIVDSVVSSIKKKKVFVNYVDNLPTEEHAIKLSSLEIPSNIEQVVWDEFQKHNKSTVGLYIKNIEAKLNQMKGAK